MKTNYVYTQIDGNNVVADNHMTTGTKHVVHNQVVNHVTNPIVHTPTNVVKKVVETTTTKRVI